MTDLYVIGQILIVVILIVAFAGLSKVLEDSVPVRDMGPPPGAAYIVIFVGWGLLLGIGLLLREVFAFLEFETLAKYSPSFMALLLNAACIFAIWFYGVAACNLLRSGKKPLALMMTVALLPLCVFPVAFLFDVPDSLQSVALMTFIGSLPTLFAASAGWRALRAGARGRALAFYFAALVLSPLTIAYYLWRSGKSS